METFKIIIMGKIMAVRYYVENNRTISHTYGVGYYSDVYNGMPEMRKSFECMKDERLYSCTMDKPQLQDGEALYINELDITVSITKVVRSTNGEYVVFTSHVIKEVEDEKTKESFNMATIRLEEELKRYHSTLNLTKKVAELENELYRLNNKKWYHFFKK